MSIGAYCVRCESAFCNHCLQINEHNSRMEYARYQAGMMMEIPPELTVESANKKIGTKVNKDKKLLLLRSPSK